MIKARSYGGVTFPSKSVAHGLDELIHTAAMLGDYNGRERPRAAGYAGILRWSPNFGQMAKIGSCS
jgi:transposase